MKSSFTKVNLGLIEYRAALEKQAEYVDRVTEGLKADPPRDEGFLIFCTHPPVVTVGRATEAGDVIDWRGDTIEVSRGGRATYHGPNQMIVYPILNLNSRRRDIGLYLRSLEGSLIRTLAFYGLSAQKEPTNKLEVDSSSDAQPAGRPEKFWTGVWIGNQKMASIGVAVKSWVTFHGIALNVFDDPNAFQGIRPCGFLPQTMTSMESQLRKMNQNDIFVGGEESKAKFLADLQVRFYDEFVREINVTLGNGGNE